MNIIVKLQKEGIHFWKDCPLEEVDYLANAHRHIFHITCKKEVKHGDRDIEIIMFKHQIEDYLDKRYGRVAEFGSKSCEMIAQELKEIFELNYCSVLEDNENGAEVW
jgi:hypothetical protein